MFLFYCSLAIIAVVSAKNEEYMGFRVYNLTFSTQEQQDKFHLLKSDLIEFWQRPNLQRNVVGQAMVPPSHFPWFEEQLEKLGIERSLHVTDVFEFLKEKDPTPMLRNNRNFDYTDFYRYNEILNHLNTLKESYANNPNINVDIIQHGVTDQNRPLVYLKISRATTAIRPVVIIEAGIIPNEWITIPAVLNTVDRILEGSAYLDAFDWIVVPVVNPDGYEYTHTNLRLWSKSRSTRSNLGIICPGVNINRNFDLDWSHFDSSSSPCSHLYAGVEPFSEPETKLLKHLIDEYGTRTRLYLSLQNNGGFLTYPWHFEKAASGMFRQHHLTGIDAVNAMNENYILGAASVVFGERASGTSVDYVRSNGLLYTFNIDIVQRGNGVLIPAGEIRSIVDDVWRGISAIVNSII
ncbi:carboxypeptidase B [Bombyx mori]|uniref:Peptidase M14 domain-containing protein n=1 Tax=Bombyx mori TaxID=7091 RepID=A0A8R2AJU2_BOMMO|nr:carboxypeptidase B [Bombyx mori]